MAEGDHVYVGRRRGLEIGVYVREGDRIRPLRHVVAHHARGFDWGYDGQAPADLALSILADAMDYPADTDADLARTRVGRLILGAHLQFRTEYVAQFAHSDWQLRRDEVQDWLDDYLPAPTQRRLEVVERDRNAVPPGPSPLEQDVSDQIANWEEAYQRERDERSRLDLMVAALAAGTVPGLDRMSQDQAEDSLRLAVARLSALLGIEPDLTQVRAHLEAEVEELEQGLQGLAERVDEVRRQVTREADRAVDRDDPETAHRLLDLAGELQHEVADIREQIGSRWEAAVETPSEDVERPLHPVDGGPAEVRTVTQLRIRQLARQRGADDAGHVDPVEGSPQPDRERDR